MRTKLLFCAAALAGLTTTGCSVLFNGSSFQGGTATDSGMPSDMGTPVDTGTLPVDGGPDSPGPSCHDVSGCPGTLMYCDTASGVCRSGCDEPTDCTGTSHGCDMTAHTCTAPIPCTTSASCMGDAYCNTTGGTGSCEPCDADGDHYYAAAAGVSCVRPAHPNGGDCDDGNPLVYPEAPANCATHGHACDLGITIPLGPGMTIHEVGLTDEHTVFSDSMSLVAPRGAVWVGAGDDRPAVTGGSTGGYVGFVGVVPGATTHSVYGVPLQFAGATVPPTSLFSLFDVAAASFTNVRDGSGNDVVILSAASSVTNEVGMMIGPVGRPAMTWQAPVATGLGATLYTAGGSPSVGAITAAGVPSLLAMLNATSGGNPFLVTGIPVENGREGPANVVGGTWIATAGTGALWIASSVGAPPTSGSVGIWNGAEQNISPPTVNLDSFTSSAPVTVLSPNFRGDLAVRSIGGNDHFVAVVPIASTSTPPVGRIVILRWSWPTPSAGASVAPYVTGSAMSIHELDLGVTHRLNGLAGVAVEIVSDSDAFVTYQDGSGVVLRPISLIADPTSTVENPPSVTLLQTGAGENFVGLDVDGGFYPDSSGMSGMGRIVVAGMVERGVGGMMHEIRVRALEACITSP